MLKKIIIFQDKQNIYTLAYNQDDVLEYYLQDKPNSSYEAVFNAKVIQIYPKNKIAFVNYLPECTGMLNLPLVSKPVQRGSKLICQLVWEGDKEKLAKLSLSIKLVGRYVILLNNDNKAAKHYFSRNLHIRSELTIFSERYAKYSLIFRSKINSLSELTLLEQELKALLQKQSIINQLKNNEVNSADMQLTSGIAKHLQLLRNATYADDLQIVTNSKYIYSELAQYTHLWQIRHREYSENLSVDIDVVRVQLHGSSIKTTNANIVIHELSGINLIDINSGQQQIPLTMVNYLALEEVVRQIKMRDLSGIILIDCIKNMSLKDEQRIIDKLSNLLEHDWRASRVLGFTRAGILEVIRNK